MRTTLTTLVLLTLLTGGVAVAHEGHARKPAPATSSRPGAAPAGDALNMRSRAATLRGELIDPQCWFMHDARGADHASCAVTCAKGGQALALLESGTGRVYTILGKGHGKNPNDGLYGHIGKPLEIRGVVFDRGANAGLLVQSVTVIR